MGRSNERITRVEVHLSDLSSSSKTRDNDKRCVMEVDDPKGRTPAGGVPTV